MKLTRYTHACIRIEHDDGVLVIDPGIWSEPVALLGADAVLVTHEHADHIDEFRLLGLGVPVFAPAGAAITRVPFVPVRAGKSFIAAGVDVTAYGGVHAPVAPGPETCVNLGYLVGRAVYHPGDALTVPDAPVDTLLVPMQASWLKTVEAMAFLTEVAPKRAIGIHDGQINERAIGNITYWLKEAGRFEWWAPGSTLSIP